MALFPNDTTHSEDLLRFSERAMYAAKQEGRNRYRFFKPIMQAHVQKRSLLLQELRKALVDYPFVLHYQPIIELATGKVTKLEALIRWPHPTLGLINPSEFIPLAEEAGMIGEISDWVFHQATQDIARWRANIDPALQVGINLSPALFQKGNRRIQSWLQHLTEMNLPGQAVMGEITEGMLLNSTDSVVRRFAALRAADIKIALDDFGTGYASLSYLKKFDIGLIKIDKSFVQNLSPQSSDMALCEAIIVMAHKLGLAVVAEGIETAAQHALLAAAGCNFGQGYLFAKPMAAGAVDTWLSQSRLRPPIAATA
jgi:EAL domain-containing protein (putative c-di-GMP-specific phosphodiesterase class I)